MSQEPQLPEPGTWVVNDERQSVARVKDAYIVAGDRCLDLVLYARSGDRLGRVSEACGGPRNFEPACPAERWTPIHKPAFPLPRYGSLQPHVRLLTPAATEDPQS